jgi:hypothetical protein
MLPVQKKSDFRRRRCARLADDVNRNVYTQTSLANRLEAVEEIAAAFVN